MDKLSDPAVQALLRQATDELRARSGSLKPGTLQADVDASLRELTKTGVYTAAHGQLRLDFASPIPLDAQTGTPHRGSIRSVVFSIHAVATNYDPIKGMQDEYPLALGVYSAQEKYEGSVLQKKNNFRQYKLDISHEDLVDLITLYLKRAEPLFRERPYNTLSANCGGIWFETADDAFMLRKHPDRVEAAKNDVAAAVGRGYPKYAQYALQAYGLLQDPDNLEGEPWTEPH
jgi:hypothetical protein